MKPFLDHDFLLQNDTARILFHEHAKKMPIIDYHCHISPKEIAEDRHFQNITQLWLGGDHYKWRQMRAAGIEEKYITGDASDYEKFCKFAETLQRAVGNPLYHWSHLELKTYFGYDGILSPKTADTVWNLCNEKLADASFSARQLILRSNVTVLCTTDDPADSLCWHQALFNDSSFPVRVLPAWRPDRAMNLEKPDYTEYLQKLSEAAGMPITNYSELKSALCNRLSFFIENGCRITDHGLETIPYSPISDEEADRILKKRLSGEIPSGSELESFRTAFLLFMGREYAKRNLVMQLHYGTRRDNNRRMYAKIGVDTGFDCIQTQNRTDLLAAFLNALDETGELPKTILYSLNPVDNAAIDTIMACFQEGPSVGKLQHGSAWWFNDNKQGMQDQLTSLSNLGLLSTFIGMLTDSRSFVSYTRHEYFRRILCNYIGTLVENGEYPNDLEFLGQMVEDISYNNCRNYFGF